MKQFRATTTSPTDAPFEQPYTNLNLAAFLRDMAEQAEAGNIERVEITLDLATPVHISIKPDDR